MSDPAVLVFEVGGTSLRAGLFDPATRHLLGTARAETPNHERLPGADAAAILDAVVGRMAEAAAPWLARAAAVSVGWPGPVAPSGLAYSSPTILGGALDRPWDVGATLRARFAPLPVTVANELTMVAWRYAAEPSGADFCLVNLGSGVGNKVVLGGRPLVGPSGRGGEIGHYAVDPSPDAPVCECGGRGHLAGIASGRGALRHCRRAAERDPAACPLPAGFGNAEIAAAFRAGEPWTTARVGETLAPLGQALASLHTALGLERFVLIGGWAQALAPGLLPALAASCAASAWDLGQDWSAMLEAGREGDEDGLLGAGLAAAQAYISV